MAKCEKCGAIANKEIELEVWDYKINEQWVRMCDSCFTLFKQEYLKKNSWFGFNKAKIIEKLWNTMEFKDPECDN